MHRLHLNCSIKPTVVLFLAVLPGIGLSATLTVTTIADDGEGSLRQAISDANAANGEDEIVFAVAGVITPTSALPLLADQVVIDATKHGSYSNHPVVELNGTAAGSGVVGLRLGSGCTVRGLAINQFSADGIRLEGTSNKVQACFIGTDIMGMVARGNGQYGIFVYGSSGNLIGGTNTADRNLISGGNATGIYLLNATASSNLIVGNFIGTTISGDAALGNLNNGIILYSAPRNSIGGTTSGAGNLISGNGGSGINLNTSSSRETVIQGNYIGTDASGTFALGNATDGITMNGAGWNLVGGTNPGARNLISGNGQAGISLGGAGAVSNLVQGNFIGTDATGKAALGNAYSGVTLANAFNNSVGGTVGGAGNVISGNRLDGVFLTGGSMGNLIQGNCLGVAFGGTNRLGNSFDGVGINGAVSNIVGGVELNARNIIGGNTNNGVLIFGPGANGNWVQGNFIGTDAAGRTAIGNAQAGVRIESAENTVGGGGAGNLISGNGAQGVWLVGAGASGNVVQANLIGTATGGTNGLANAKAGVGITDASTNLIGGIGGLGNVISYNTEDGVFIFGAAARGNQIQGNRIGTDIGGNFALANGIAGIYVEAAASNTIGGMAAGAGNLVSGNHFDGIWIKNSSGNVLQGNLVGTKADGVSNLGNGNYALELDTGANNNLIGSSVNGFGNRFAFSQGPYVGVRVRDGAVNNGVLCNAIFGNGALGIDLGAYGATANDNCDADPGGNQLQNFPLLTEAFSGGNTGVRGSMNSQSGKIYLLQFFSNPACDSLGYGEGQVFLGEISVNTGAACLTNFTANFPVSVPPGQVITATATDPANNTSEFSPCVSVQPLPRLDILSNTTSQITLAWTNAAVGFGLKQTDSLSPPITWVTVTNVPVLAGGRLMVTLPATADNRFYLLSLE